MKWSICRVASLLGTLTLMVAGCFGAYQVSPDAAQTVGGLTPTIEDKDAGLVAIAPGFAVKTYEIVVVDKFPVTDSAIKDEEDRGRAREMSTFFQSELVRRLRETGLFARVVNLSETEFQPGTERTLRLEGVITRLGQGSQAARAMWGLYGAGAARVQAELRFIDVQSRTPMLLTADRRQASMGAFGGSARDHWREAFDDMARDLGKFLVRLGSGQAPAKQ